ncbi:MAG TPA: tol-pal system protein YbgF [Steroidobacteraceae bacterium]|nr:tol-pal system protein YbgF [Steroidobacteraceae bacterium]
MRHPRLPLAGTLMASIVLGGCSLTPAEEDPVQVRLADLDARVAKVERIIANQSLVELSQRVEALEAHSRELQGRSEVQENAVEGAKQQQRDLYNDLDRRLSALESGVPEPPREGSGAAASSTVAAAPAAAGEPPSAADQQAAYDAAFAALKDARYADAITGFRALLEAAPTGDLAPNSQYWLGEAYYVTRDFENAAVAFEAVAERWPDSGKAPGALLKLGYSQYELKRLGDARQTLGRLTARYPDTEAARLAQDRIQRIIAEQR